jgi:hypothetical protein
MVLQSLVPIDRSFGRLNTPEIYTNRQVFQGSPTSLSQLIAGAAAEKVTVISAPTAGTITLDIMTSPILYFTANATANWSLALRGSSTSSINSLMNVGESVTVAFLSTQGGTAYYQTSLTIDGLTITPKWQGGTAPAAGNINSIDGYVCNIIKTGPGQFTVLEAQTRFA